MLKEAMDKIQSNFIESGELDSETEAALLHIQSDLVTVAKLLAEMLLLEIDDAGLTDSSAIDEYTKALEYLDEATQQDKLADVIAKYKDAWKQDVVVLDKEWGITEGIAQPP
jgi:hypothetical protein